MKKVEINFQLYLNTKSLTSEVKQTFVEEDTF